MDWQDEGTVLSARGFGERDAIVSLMTFEHGRHVGLVRAGGSSRIRPILQQGTRVTCEWRARLADHLGTFRLEPIQSLRAAVLEDPSRLAAVETCCTLVDICLGERDPHPRICAALMSLVGRVGAQPDWLADIPRFELLLLAELGFGLDVSGCALGGPKSDLAYVSPRTGRAVSRVKAQPYLDKLLPLPGFLVTGDEPDTLEILGAFRLSGYFLTRKLLDPADRTLPDARSRLLRHLQADLGDIEPDRDCA